MKQAVCQADKPCPIFDTPWQVEQSKSGKTTISGLSVMANMVETLRLGWSENLPLSQLAWGKITQARQITALLPLLTENYDLSNDVLYTAQKTRVGAAQRYARWRQTGGESERTLAAAGGP